MVLNFCQTWMSDRVVINGKKCALQKNTPLI